MRLPGGLWQQGCLQHEAGFRPVDGHLEMALAEVAGGVGDIPGRVSAALVAALARIGSLTPDAALVEALSVADRQFLMVKLACHLGLERVWLRAACSHCQCQFDFALDFAAIPVKPAAHGYPFADLELSSGRVRVRAPTGQDQRAILSLPDTQQASVELARRCIVGPSVELSGQDITRIESALEALAPELATHASAQCPECGGNNAVEIDPYYCLGRVGNELFVEIHQLAVHYHWSEAEILGLPRWRRKKYLALIDRTRGMTT